MIEAWIIHRESHLIQSVLEASIGFREGRGRKYLQLIDVFEEKMTDARFCAVDLRKLFDE